MSEMVDKEQVVMTADAGKPDVEAHQLLWSSLDATQSPEQFYRSWLELLSVMGGRKDRQLLLVGRGADDRYLPLAVWPEEEAPSEQLAEAVEQAVEENCGLVLDIDELGHRYAVAYPVHVDNFLKYVVAADIVATSDSVLTRAMERLQWGSSWLEVLLRRMTVDANRREIERMTLATDLLSQVLDEQEFEPAAMTLVTELAHQMSCERVSLGLLKGDDVRVEALSHSAQFGKKMNLIRSIEAAMDEAILQNCSLVYPDAENAESTLICREHETLATDFGAGAIMTVPLFNGEHYYGAITLERDADSPFTAEEKAVCPQLAALAGVALREKCLNDRTLWIKIKDAALLQFQRMFGPKYVLRKIVATSLVFLTLCTLFLQGDYRLSADTILEGSVQRMVVAPFNGYIAETGARAGDVVNENDLLCRLDDRDLRLERMNWLSQKSQLQKQRQDALAKHDRAQVNILGAQLAQAEAQLELIATNLARTMLVAPYRGLVTSGDLSQRLGGSVQQGEMLFEVAPLDQYRVILKVDERRIADVENGQEGVLVLTSLPEKSFDFEVAKITPITTTEEGNNYFRVEAKLLASEMSLRPGMEGVGKIMIDRRNLFGIWTRDLREWLTLWFWSWWP